MPPVLLNEIGREELFRDLGLSNITDHDGADNDVDEDVEQVLAAFHGRSSATSPHIRQLAAVLESANLLDEAFEADAWAPGELKPIPCCRIFLQISESSSQRTQQDWKIACQYFRPPLWRTLELSPRAPSKSTIF